MAMYEVTVRTSREPHSGSYCGVQVTLIGVQGESLPASLDPEHQHLTPGSACAVTVRVDQPLGPLVLVRLRLKARPGFPEQDWHCQAVEVSLGSETDQPAQLFPCNKWLQPADGDIELRNGQVCTVNSETLQVLKEHRAKELQTKQQHFRWCTFAEGVSSCVDFQSLKPLGPNLTYTRKSPGVDTFYLKGFTDRPWGSFEELQTLFAFNARDNITANFVRAHWSEDSFFGYQALNGCNPLELHQIRQAPPNLSVSTDMLRPFLPEGSSLEQEMERGTIFLLDYKVLDGVPANTVNGKQQYLAAPLCILHYSQQGELKPIAIQLQQTPGAQNPVFVPSDPDADWLLAKMWVKNADFQCHQLLTHFLNTHLLGEVYCTATLRQLPEVHPLHQLIMPHVWTTLQINIQARLSLLAPGGVFDKSMGVGLEGIPVLLRKGAEQLKYSALCVPEDLSDRGVRDLPINYYSQDVLRVWSALHRFVGTWVDLYYPTDGDVHQDTELQMWIQEVFTHGALGQSETGFPQAFRSKTELSKFVTMVIYSCSALHAAVNFSQADFNLWMPNTPFTMSCPPPQSKGSVSSREALLSILPPANSTCSVLTTLILLSKPALDFVPLGHYREAHFSSGAPQRLVEALQKELKVISGEIAERNTKLQLPYPYLSPESIENSVAI
ncbi:polyunsaturated fatty acid lipoxygenase ALOX15B [Conger conger]|uniref:polyunsaturated fatty acid lipoxygenase ALOX15B n=1 Tax=Conger conger TaxID=82655 RepID=UPI002A5AC555|nr:polyunsaturated fatty acid lipoxygenase ALOX15B [Conger conger]